jgi:hypothetical protein
MALSQNVRFSGDAAPDDVFKHPPGGSIARLLKTALFKRGWGVSEIDNWRDAGWCITCCRDESRLDVALCQDGTGPDWFLQVAPTYVPGPVGRLFGKNVSASSLLILALAQDIHGILSELDALTDFKWCWDGYPEVGASTPKPEHAEGSG